MSLDLPCYTTIIQFSSSSSRVRHSRSMLGTDRCGCLDMARFQGIQGDLMNQPFSRRLGDRLIELLDSGDFRKHRLQKSL